MKNDQIEGCISLEFQMIGVCFKSVHKYSYLIFILFKKKVRDSAVDYESISAFFIILNHLDHFQIFRFRNLLLETRRGIKGKKVGECHNSSLFSDCHVCKTQRFKSNRYSMYLHKLIEKMKIAYLNLFSLIHQLIYVINKTYCFL